MRFAVVTLADGTIEQITDADTSDTLEDVNARLTEGLQAVECGQDVTLQYVFLDGQFVPPAT